MYYQHTFRGSHGSHYAKLYYAADDRKKSTMLTPTPVQVKALVPTRIARSKPSILNVEQISGKPDLCRVDLTFEDAPPDETVEIAFADLPMTGMPVVNAIATTRETALTISGRTPSQNPRRFERPLLCSK
jgi:hypothetical protein